MGWSVFFKRLQKLFTSRQGTSLLIMALRVFSMGTKFLLTLFLARYLGLAELGQFGLITGVIMLTPLVVSMGLQNALSRDMVGIAAPQVTAKLKSYWQLMLALYIVLLLGVALAGALLPQLAGLAGLVWAMTVTEHISQDIYTYLVSQQRQLAANAMLFIKNAASPLAFMVAAYLWPQVRDIPTLLTFLILGNLVPVIYFTRIALNWPWKTAHNPEKLTHSIWTARYLFVSDLSLALTQYADRFLIVMFLGLEAAGIYIFFWQIGSAVFSLVGTSILQIYKPKLIHAHKQRNDTAYAQAMKSAALSSLSVVSIMAIGAGGALTFVLPYVKPELVAYPALMWIILAGTIIRTLSTLVGFNLYARRKDKRYAAIVLVTSLGACAATGLVLLTGGGLQAVALVNIGVLLTTLLLRLKS